MPQYPVPSPIERAYGFVDPNFRAYILAKGRHIKTFMDMSESMGESDHPLVRYAAGWAAAEYATYPHPSDPDQIDLSVRVDALDQAKEHWREAEKTMPALRQTQTSEELIAQVQSIEVRVAQALTYIPIMEVVASSLNGNLLDKEQAKIKCREVKAAALEIGSLAMNLPHGTVVARNAKSGLVSEMVCALLLHTGEPSNHLIIPASFRERNGRFHEKRASHSAIMIAQPHNKVSIRTEPGWRPVNEVDSKILRFYSREDLSSRPTDNPYNTLDAFIDWKAGRASPATISRLQVAGRNMVQRLEDYESERLRQSQSGGKSSNAN